MGNFQWGSDEEVEKMELYLKENKPEWNGTEKTGLYKENVVRFFEISNSNPVFFFKIQVTSWKSTWNTMNLLRRNNHACL